MVRIVKMKFKSEEIENFKQLFKEKKSKIESNPGCKSVSLLQDKHDPNTIFTYSIWDNELSLNNYRQSEFFKDTWQATKAKFDGKPEAWSLETQTFG